jgi:predicted small secreted protein
MPRTRRVLLQTCLVAFAVFALSACNTVRGMGQDIKKAGEKVEDAAD